MQDCFQPQYKQVIFRLPHFKTHLNPEMLPSHIESQPPAVLLEMSTWEPAQPHAVPVQGQIYGKYMGNIQEYHGNIKYMGYSIYIYTYHDRGLRPFHIPDKKKHPGCIECPQARWHYSHDIPSKTTMCLVEIHRFAYGIPIKSGGSKPCETL